MRGVVGVRICAEMCLVAICFLPCPPHPELTTRMKEANGAVIAMHCNLNPYVPMGSEEARYDFCSFDKNCLSCSADCPSPWLFIQSTRNQCAVKPVRHAALSTPT
ncbi:hypothetical protein JOQ06_009235 [Pogonophryne albipinna]|uniref:Secreted protein n=1 Tax=Pogonophryne albipinna TaxID=1090488 RepID=A0AAD6BLU0_9TELE|nr:hypothetical protein JOQ06_009235 [Pogonophryne albipinna]